ncbi:hypothetical protein PENPOL_c044G02110 [Penicillium polonicum]|uniref:Uncharacterized protein n=1 Tax=Penicillium polonicum TaxID=60169 RepID=A0A1V6N5I8_PENPO|nr:hypothetical protein PENPOL_c044G02110 [Penicillium polonicum]
MTRSEAADGSSHSSPFSEPYAPVALGFMTGAGAGGAGGAAGTGTGGGPSVTIPPLEMGSDDDPGDPGAWARHVMGFPWVDPKGGDILKGATVGQLKKLTTKREPRTRKIVAPDLHVKTGKTATNLEAVMAQVVGDDVDEECEECARGLGPFTTCVTVEEELKGACANCHWVGQGYKCSFRKAAAAAIAAAIAADESVGEVAQPKRGAKAAKKPTGKGKEPVKTVPAEKTTRPARAAKKATQAKSAIKKRGSTNRKRRLNDIIRQGDVMQQDLRAIADTGNMIKTKIESLGAELRLMVTNIEGQQKNAIRLQAAVQGFAGEAMESEEEEDEGDEEYEDEEE